MKVFIVGGGKVGFYLAKTLLEEGNEVRLVEIRRESCERISSELDIPVYCGDGTTVEVLSAAGIGSCDVFVSVTGSDECNLISCQLAKKQFGVKKTVARVCNPKNAEILKRLGVDIAVSSTQIISNIINYEIDGAQIRFITDINNNDVVISDYRIPENWSKSGTMIKDLAIPDGCVMIYLIRSKNMLIPRGNTVLMENDEIIALTVGSSSKELKKLLEIQ